MFNILNEKKVNIYYFVTFNYAFKHELTKLLYIFPFMSISKLIISYIFF